jgi:hypothetical protein
LDRASSGASSDSWIYNNKNPFPVVVQVNGLWAVSAEALSHTPVFFANARDSIEIHEHNGELSPGTPAPGKHVAGGKVENLAHRQ